MTQASPVARDNTDQRHNALHANSKASQQHFLCEGPTPSSMSVLAPVKLHVFYTAHKKREDKEYHTVTEVYGLYFQRVNDLENTQTWLWCTDNLNETVKVFGKRVDDIEMPPTTTTKADLMAAVSKALGKRPGCNILNNCNHFTDRLLRILCQRGLPFKYNAKATLISWLF